MATVKTTSKTNPITGDPSKKAARQAARTERKDTRALNKSLNEGITKQGDAKIYYKGVPVEKKSMLDGRMEKYGVTPTSSKGRSQSLQNKINRNQIKLAKNRVKAQERKERNANPTKFDTFVAKTLGTGKYDRGSMKKTIVGNGNGGSPNPGKMDKSCKKPK